MDNRSGYAYLRAIYSLHEENKDATTTSISAFLGVKAGSASEMITKLAKYGYVKHTPYKKIWLTVKGKKEARKAVRRHRLIEDFLVRILKIKENVSSQAEAMESVLNDKTDIELCRFLERPLRDPVENKEIPHCEKKIACENCLKGEG